MDTKLGRLRRVVFWSLIILVIALYFTQILLYLTKTLIKYNEDIDRNTAQIIESRGFKAEDHYIVTEDEYILLMTRIVNPLVKDRSSLRPILLHHGWTANAKMFLINSMGTLNAEGRYVEDNHSGAVGNSLGFVLAANGYDVWLANMRGTEYSANHTKLKPEDPEFWRFSIDELIEYDLPAMISHIQKITQKDQLAYIGHSQGNLEMFGLLSSQPKYSQIIKPFIALSPVFYLDFSTNTSPILRYGQYIYWYLRSADRPFLATGHSRIILARLCDSSSLARRLCFRMVRLGLEWDVSQVNYSRSTVYMANGLTGSSSRNYAHFLQMPRLGDVKKFDFGDPELNLAKYNSTQPPVYDLSAINSTNIAIIYTANDWFNHLNDVQRLKDSLKDDYLIPNPEWNHNEMVWGVDAGRLVNSRVVDILAKTYL